MDIVSGPARVVECGLVTAFMGNPIRLQLDNAAAVELVFETTPDQPEVRVETEWVDDGIRFLCFNFDGADGRGSKDPALLGEWGDGELLFFHFRVFRWGTTGDRTLHYTLYAVAKEAVEWTGEPPDASDNPPG